MAYSWSKDIIQWRGMIKLMRRQDRTWLFKKLQRSMRKNRDALFNKPRKDYGRRCRYNKFIAERRKRHKA